MLTQHAFDHFGNQAMVAKVLGISAAAVSKWPKIVPLESALALEIVTDRKLRVDPKKYPRIAAAMETQVQS